MNTPSYPFHSKVSSVRANPYHHSYLLPKAISAMFEEIDIPRPTNISLLNEYGACFEFSAEYDASIIVISLQKVATWFSFNVEIRCTVTGPDQVVNIRRGQTGSKLV